MMDIQELLTGYDLKNLTVGSIGSHSALDISAGAKKQGFRTLVVAERGRDQTYDKYFKRQGELGCVDECLVLEKFKQLLDEDSQQQLRDRSTVFVPNRSFEVYLDFDYQAIENDFKVPVFGNRALLKIEERGKEMNQYDVLAAADLRFPKQFTDPGHIDRLCLVKVLEAERGFERAFFLAWDKKSYEQKVEEGLKAGKFTQAQLADQVIEEFVVGAPVNFNFFFSPLTGELELLGTDTRRQTNLEGVLRLPSKEQAMALEALDIKYEEAGHMAVTVLESMLEEAFAMGERFVTAARKLFDPGVIGPFALQAIVTPGPPKKEIVVIDVSPRMPGSPGITATPYTTYRYGRPVGVGERVAMEIKQAADSGRLGDILS